MPRLTEKLRGSFESLESGLIIQAARCEREETARAYFDACDELHDLRDRLLARLEGEKEDERAGRGDEK